MTRSENINRFFNDIRSYKPMTREEEISLFDRVASGDRSAVEEITNRNMKFVVSRAKSYTNDGDLVADLIQEGSIGLYDAIGRYDLERGFRFISFAVYYIDMHIRQFLFGLNPVTQSNDRKIAPKVRKIRSQFFELNQREATEWEIAEILESEYGIEVKDLRDLNTMSFTSIDKETGEEDCTVMDYGEISVRTASFNEFERESEREEKAALLSRLMCKLTSREKEVISMHYGLNGNTALDDEAIADRLGLCAERVRQIRKGAERRMAA